MFNFNWEDIMTLDICNLEAVGISKGDYHAKRFSLLW